MRMLLIFFKILNFLENHDIGHLLKTSRGYFRPPKIFRKEMDNISITFVYIFEKCSNMLSLS